ncbi:hypothetical protein ET495_12155 [Xylanimonas allomyrinae]|uniref:Uncharacterized protein n=1 Tax=Xylanimonas allomyrinae TaxID=2509459 RepID=A0A4P6EPW6_9MICO|nr:hypothetical protein [Xylanimonas allomyrinae]QAY63863.1 hypothetical protein ET495_12155 [Xylanimonas allomyrinae]
MAGRSRGGVADQGGVGPAFGFGVGLTAGPAARAGGGPGVDGAAVELEAARAALADALDGLGRAAALAWASPAAEVFRDRLAQVVAATRRDARAVDDLRSAVARLAVRG